MLTKYPFKNFRPGTEEAIKKIEAAFNSGKKFVLVNSPTGCHAIGTKVIMYDGSLKNVEDIEVGDLLMGPDNTSRTVLELCRGRDKMYEIIPHKGGKSFVVNGDHILSLKSTNEGISKIIYSGHKNHKTGNEYGEISVNDYLKKSKYFKHIWKLYRVPILNWGYEEDLPIDPYIVGLLLGDGSITKNVGITTADVEIEQAFNDCAAEHNLKIRTEFKINNLASSYYASTGRTGKVGCNPLINKLRQLNIFGCNADTKHIPKIYKFSSWNNRLEILAGLLDSDGSLNKNCFDFCIKSKQLFDDSVFIARSLGFCVSTYVKIVKGTTYHRANISGDTNLIPTRLDRKKAGRRLQKKNPLVSGFKINPLGNNDYYGFILDKDHLYLLEDFTATHNSGKSGLAVAFSRKYKTTIWTPTKLLQDQYASTPEFIYEYEIKGKSNYNCGLSGQEHVTVDEALCCSASIVDENRDLIPFTLPQDKSKLAKSLKVLCTDNGICPYYTKLARIPTNPGAILNYDLGLRIKKNIGNVIQGVDLGDAVVLDEAHQLINKANSIFGYELTNTGAMKIFGQEGKRNKGEEVLAWLDRLANLAEERMESETDRKKASRYSSFQRRLSGILEHDLNNAKKFYIEDRQVEIEIKPLDLRYFKAHLFYPFKKVLMLSATFPANFCQVLGLNEDEYEIINIQSTFPIENRRVVFAADIENMNVKTVLTKDSQQIKMLEYVIAAHKNDKGIIHCGNYKLFDQLREILKGNSRFLWVDQEKNKEEMIYLHSQSKKPTILVSPAMLEGVDLKNDLARFGVLIKVPYAPFDEYNKRMNAIFPQWYENLAITNVVQAYGRQVRNEEDYAIFYILDGAFKLLLTRSKKLFSPYFTEALKIGDCNKLVKFLNQKIEQNKV